MSPSSSDVIDLPIPKRGDAGQAATRVRSRIAALENDLVEVTADVLVAGEGGNPPQEARKADLEATIERLEEWAEKLDAAAKAKD